MYLQHPFIIIVDVIPLLFEDVTLVPQFILVAFESSIIALLAEVESPVIPPLAEILPSRWLQFPWLSISSLPLRCSVSASIALEEDLSKVLSPTPVSSSDDVDDICNVVASFPFWFESNVPAGGWNTLDAEVAATE